MDGIDEDRMRKGLAPFYTILQGTHANQPRSSHSQPIATQSQHDSMIDPHLVGRPYPLLIISPFSSFAVKCTQLFCSTYVLQSSLSGHPFRASHEEAGLFGKFDLSMWLNQGYESR